MKDFLKENYQEKMIFSLWKRWFDQSPVQTLIPAARHSKIDPIFFAWEIYSLKIQTPKKRFKCEEGT